MVNDVQRYAITNAGHWDAALTDPSPGPGGPPWPEPRESHTLADQVQGPYFLFGGKDAAGTRRDVWQLVRDDTDLSESYKWIELNPINDPVAGAPPTRWGHAAVAATPNTQNPNHAISTMYVHGGENTEGPSPVTLGDLWKIEWNAITQEWNWKKLAGTAADSSHIPTARSGHSAFWDRSNQRLILYGGANPGGTVTDPNVYVLRFPGGVPTWNRATSQAGSRVPFARARHALAADLTTSGTASGIVFGGLTASGLSDSLWEFTVDAQDVVRWTPWPPNGPAPAARAGASIILYETHPRSFVLAANSRAAPSTRPCGSSGATRIPGRSMRRSPGRSLATWRSVSTGS